MTVRPPSVLRLFVGFCGWIGISGRGRFSGDKGMVGVVKWWPDRGMQGLIFSQVGEDTVGGKYCL